MSEGSPTEEFGPYIVYEQLGVGGMAQVHRAVAAKDAFQRSVALKRMLSHIAGSEDMVKSFVREARLASYLRHENVAQTYDLGRVGDTYFIVMELITGRNLREVLRHCGVTTGPMPVQFALNILNQVCDALDYAHNLCDETGQPLGIIHRDVSPSNVIVSETGVVKLIDFGIAKASGGGMQTMSGTLKGKFAYMAPEYIGGRIDARADLFAIGVIAHELLTNRPLFTGRDDIDTLSRVRDMPIPPPSKKNPQVPPEIDDIVMTALERDPERRWQHATALRTALTTLTRRLGLIASNAQVVQWLDWAFSQPSKQGRQVSDHDADTDSDTETADKTADEPSISIEQETVEHRTTKPRVSEPPAVAAPSQSMSQKVTLLLGDDAPTPPSRPPIGTPGSLPAQTSSPPASNASLASPAALATPPRPDASGRHPVLPPRSVAAGTAAPASRVAATPAAAAAASRVAATPAAPASRVAAPATAAPTAPRAAGTAAPTASAGSAAARASSNLPARLPAASAAPPVSRTRSASAPPPPAVPLPAAQSLQVAPELLAQSQSVSSRASGASLSTTPSAGGAVSAAPSPHPAAPSPHAAADSGLAPSARTIPIMGAAPAFPASRVRSPSAPPPPSFQAALQNLSASSTAAASRTPSAPPAQGFHAAPPLGLGSTAPSSAPQVAPAAPGHGFNPALASPAPPGHGFNAALASAAAPGYGFNAALASPSHGLAASPSSPPQSFNAAPSRPSAQGLPPSAQPIANGPAPVVPVLNSAPFAAPRSSAPSISPAPAAPRPTSPILIAILVLLAAAGAAITVYFVLPLLT